MTASPPSGCRGVHQTLFAITLFTYEWSELRPRYAVLTSRLLWLLLLVW